MKVKCIHNKGKDLRPYEYADLEMDRLGRFGATGHTEYNGLKIGEEYLVMGIIVFDTYSAYLVDDGTISVLPCQLFEVIDDRINSDWHFRLLEKDEDLYPYIQCIFGYAELCNDKNAYEKLIVDREYEAQRIFVRRKIELEKETA